MRITSKGQSTIPTDIHGKAGLRPHTQAAFEFDDMGVRLLRAEAWKKDG